MTAPAGTWADDLGLALALGERAAVLSLLELDQPLRVESKTDSTPVTNVDYAVDRMLIAALRAERADDAILSEESGEHGSSARRWILDPIDGTFNLVGGHPHWGNHIALEVDGEIVVSVITRPRLGMVWWASRGGGAFSGPMGVSADARAISATPPTRLRVSTITSLSEARVSSWTDDAAVIEAIERLTVSLQPDMNDILGIAEGRHEAVVGSRGEVWDHAPAVLLVEEAGGRFRDHHGGNRIDIGPGHYTNGVIDSALAPVIDP